MQWQAVAAKARGGAGVWGGAARHPLPSAVRLRLNKHTGSLEQLLRLPVWGCQAQAARAGV